MGLRVKLLVWVGLLSAVFGGVSLLLLRASVERSYAELERETARQQFARLLQILDEELAQRDRVLREWSLWSDFYQYALDGNRDFEVRNLNPGSVAASDLLWLGFYDARRQLRASVAGQAQGGHLPHSLSPAIQALLADAEQAGRNALPCGWAGSAQQLLMLCRRPLLDGLAKDSIPRGTVAVAELLSPAGLQAVAQRAGLSLRLQALPASLTDLPGEALTLQQASASGAGPLHLDQLDGQLQMLWPLRDLAGTPIAVLEARRPLEVTARGQQLLARVQWLVLVLALAVALGLGLVVDRLVVARLVGLRRELARIREARDWGRGVSISGADEITELASGANHLLGVINSQVHVLERLSLTDALTGLANRRSFGERLSLAIRHQHRSGAPLTLLLVDVDFFKLYNDRYGHSQGDVALQAVARCLAQAARRPTDLAARIGGEEFALLLENTDLAGARQRAEELRQLLRAAAIVHEGGVAGKGGLLTLSMGLALAEPGESTDSLYQRADAALYRAKAAGRDRVEV